MDLGAGRRGVDMGPSALRLAGLNEKLASLGYEVEDLGNIVVDQPETSPVGPANARYLPQIAHTCARLADMVEQAADEAGFRWCSAAIIRSPSERSPACRAFSQSGARRLGLIWIDAHADMNTPESSPSGNVHGMPLACCIGLGPHELTANRRIRAESRSRHRRDRRTAQRGRDRAPERSRDAACIPSPCATSTSAGLRSVMQEAIAHRHARHRRLSPFVRHGRGRSAGSARRRNAGPRRHHLSRSAPGDGNDLRQRPMTSMEMVEVNPVIDEVNRTALLAVELVMSAMGKRIL